MLFYNKPKLKSTAEHHIAQGELQKALPLLQKILEREPEDTDILCLTGELLIKMGPLDGGLELLRKAASIFASQGELQKSVTLYRKVLRLDGANAEVAAELADLLHSHGQDEEAISTLLRSAKAAEADAPRAIFLLEKVLRQSPDNLPAISSLGFLYTRQKLYTRALDHLLKAGRRHFEQGDYALSFLHLETALGFAPGNRDASFLMLDSLIRLGSFEDAIGLLDRISTESDDDGECREKLQTYRIQILFETRQDKELHDLLKNGRKGVGNSPERLVVLAEKALGKGRTGLAADLLGLLDCGDYSTLGKKALYLLQQAAQQNPSSITALEKIIDIRTFTGDLTGLSSVYPRLYRLYLDGGDLARAHALLGQWMSLDESNEWIRKEARRLELLLVQAKGEREGIMGGQIEEIGLPDLIQMFESARKTGTLRIRLADLVGSLAFQDGRIVHASYRDQSGPLALIPLLRLTGGHFRFEPGLPDPTPHSIHGTNTQIVLDALRIIDEERAQGKDEELPFA